MIGLHPLQWIWVKACQNHLRSPYYTSQLLGIIQLVSLGLARTERAISMVKHRRKTTERIMRHDQAKFETKVGLGKTGKGSESQAKDQKSTRVTLNLRHTGALGSKTHLHRCKSIGTNMENMMQIV